MKLKLLTTMAGPDGCHSAGRVVEFPAMTAKSLLDGGFAVAAENTSLRDSPPALVSSGAGELESADGSAEGVIGEGDVESSPSPANSKKKTKKGG